MVEPLPVLLQNPAFSGRKIDVAQQRRIDTNSRISGNGDTENEGNKQNR